MFTRGWPSRGETGLRAAIIYLATQYGRYGHRRSTALLRAARWPVNAQRVERLWRNDGSCVRLRPERPRHVWAFDFRTDRTPDGRAFWLLTFGDEFTRECLAIVGARRLTPDDVLAPLAALFIPWGCPDPLRSDNGIEVCPKVGGEWLTWLEGRPLCIEAGGPCPWENGDTESFNGKLRDALLDREIF